jgi:hypothetical protein
MQEQKSQDPRNETDEERDDRNLAELLQELRVAGLAISAAVLLVSSFVATAVPTVLITVFIVCLFGGLWFALPLGRHRASGGPRRPVRAGPGGPAHSG